MSTMPKRRKTISAQKSEAKGKRSDYDSRDRPLNHYNLFYMLERELFLQKAGVCKSFKTNERKSDPSIVQFELYADLARFFPPRPARYQGLILPDDWFMHGKKRRSHSKHHGVVTLTEMTGAIALSWKTIDAEVKNFVYTISSMIKQRRDKIRSTRDLAERPQTSKPVMPPEVATCTQGKSYACTGPSKFLRHVLLPISHQRIDHQKSDDGNSCTSSGWDPDDSIGPFHFTRFPSSAFQIDTSSTERALLSRYSHPVVFCQFIQDSAAPNNAETNPSRDVGHVETNTLSAEAITTSAFHHHQGLQPSECDQSNYCQLVTTAEKKISIDKQIPLTSCEPERVILCQPIQEPVVGAGEASHALTQQVSVVRSLPQQLFFREAQEPSRDNIGLICSRLPLNNQCPYSRNDFYDDIMSNDEIISLYHSLA